MEYQHTEVRKFWREWLDAARKHPWHTFALLLATITMAATIVVVTAILARFGTDLGTTQSKVQSIATQTIVLTQQVNQTVRNVTEIREELADVRKLISEFYSYARTELFSPGSTNLLITPWSTNGNTAVLIRLQHVPAPPSVSIILRSEKRGPVPIAPDLIDHTAGNIISFRFGNQPSLSEITSMSYTVSYVIDPMSSNFNTRMERRGNTIYIDP